MSAAFSPFRALPCLSPAQSAEDTAPLYSYGAADAPVARAFSASLVIKYMLDEPGVPVFVRERDVERDQRQALHASALRNLQAHTATRRLRFEPQGAVYSAKLDGWLDASLLLLDELWDTPPRTVSVEGELVAAVGARGALLLTGSRDPAGLAELRARLARDTALSSELFVRRAGRWESFES